MFLEVLSWALHCSFCIQHHLHASPKNALLVTKCSLPYCVKHMWLWQEENKLKLNNYKTEAIRLSSSSSTRPCNTHRQSLSAIGLPILSLLELSATSGSSLIAIFQWNNTPLKHVRLHTLKSHEKFHSPISHWRRNQDTRYFTHLVQIRQLQFATGRLSTYSHQTTPTSTELCSQTHP